MKINKNQIAGYGPSFASKVGCCVNPAMKQWLNPPEEPGGCPLPGVSAGAAVSDDWFGLVLNGTLFSIPGTISNFGFYASLSPDPVNSGVYFPADEPYTGIGNYSLYLAISPFDCIYWVFFAENECGIAYTPENVICVGIQRPIVDTIRVYDILDVAAKAEGFINNDGGDPASCGFVWNLTGNPTLADNVVVSGTYSSGTFFNEPIIGLPAGTTIYIKAYGTNSAGTTYGNEIVFNTLPATTFYILAENSDILNAENNDKLRTE